MKVVALQKGMFQSTRRRVGDIFDIGDAKPASWMKPVRDKKEATEAAVAAKVAELPKGEAQPRTLSEIGQMGPSKGPVPAKPAPKNALEG